MRSMARSNAASHGNGQRPSPDWSPQEHFRTPILTLFWPASDRHHRSSKLSKERISSSKRSVKKSRSSAACSGSFQRRPSAILATNSSSLPSSLLVEATRDPSRLLNMHFFAPIWVRPMLEVMSCGLTSSEAYETAMAYGRDLRLTMLR